MQIHQVVRDAIQHHKKKIELTQWAVMSSVASLVYSEYLLRIKQKQHPTRVIMVPTIRSVQELLLPDGPMMQLMGTKMIDMMATHELFKKFSDAPELAMFQEENIEVMKTIFDLYVLPNIQRRLPETIAHKFDLFNPQNQTIRENREIDLFDRRPFNGEQLDYLVEQAVLQLLILLPTMKKEIEYPEANTGIYMTEDEILTVSNDNAVCPIHFNSKIFAGGAIMDVLSFVTNTHVQECDWSENALAKGENHEPVKYNVATGVFNAVYLTKLIGIEYTAQENDKGANEREEA